AVSRGRRRDGQGGGRGRGRDDGRGRDQRAGRDQRPRDDGRNRAEASRERGVVEIGTRGRLVVGEPFFEPGVPIVIVRKGLGGAKPGDLALVRTGRGRAPVEQV